MTLEVLVRFQLSTPTGNGANGSMLHLGWSGSGFESQFSEFISLFIMKTCICCKVEKDLSCFWKHARSSDWLQSMCKDCKRSYDNNYYKSNQPTLRSRKNWTDKNHRRMLLNYARDIALNRWCKLCGYNKHFAALQFHHRDQSEKVDSVSELIRRGVSLQRVKDEIEKCDVLCANCHMVITSEQLWWYN